MKAIILAGGYAKRLWPLTKDTPKPLLDVGGKSMITRIIEKIEALPEIKEIVISTNAKFEGKFREYVKKLKCSKPVRLVIEPSLSEEKKLGSIGGLNYLIDHLKIDKDTLIIGGDNIFGFDLNRFMEFSRKKNGSAIALKKIDDPELIKNYGVCVVRENHKITGFDEKPQKPKSPHASTACYFFKHSDLMMIKKYLSEGKSSDAMGFFVSWLIEKTNVHGYVFEEDWFDIGSFEQLEEARKKYGGR